jgi:hypothetical protein
LLKASKGIVEPFQNNASKKAVTAKISIAGPKRQVVSKRAIRLADFCFLDCLNSNMAIAHMVAELAVDLKADEVGHI